MLVISESFKSFEIFSEYSTTGSEENRIVNLSALFNKLIIARLNTQNIIQEACVPQIRCPPYHAPWNPRGRETTKSFLENTSNSMLQIILQVIFHSFVPFFNTIANPHTISNQNFRNINFMDLKWHTTDFTSFENTKMAWPVINIVIRNPTRGNWEGQYSTSFF